MKLMIIGEERKYKKLDENKNVSILKEVNFEDGNKWIIIKVGKCELVICSGSDKNSVDIGAGIGDELIGDPKKNMVLKISDETDGVLNISVKNKTNNQ